MRHYGEEATDADRTLRRIGQTKSSENWAKKVTNVG